MKRFFGFTLMRVFCTVATYGLYLLLLKWMRYELAYAISYGVGIVLAYATSTVVVFGQRMNRKSALLFPMVYIVQFVLGWLILRACVELLDMHAELALLISVVMLLPLSYLMSKWAVFTR